MNPHWRMGARGFFLEKPYLGRSYKNYLSNEEYGLCIDHLGAGYSVRIAEPRLFVTAHGFSLAPRGRYVYLRDLEEPGSPLWNPSFSPAKTELDSYLAEHDPVSTSLDGALGGISCRSLHFLPERGCFEIWRVSVANSSGRRRRIMIAPQAEFLLQSRYDYDITYYSWYSDSELSEDGMSLLATSRSPGAPGAGAFFRALARPGAIESSRVAFYGDGDQQRPAFLAGDPGTARTHSAGDPIAPCFRYEAELEPDGRWDCAFFIGVGEDSLGDATERFPDLDSVDRERERSLVRLGAKIETETPRSIEDARLRAWAGLFLPHQIRQQSIGMIRFANRGYRDVAQDAVGMSHYDLAASRRLILDLLEMQHEDGRCLRQWNAMGGRHDERDFRDLPFWLAFAVRRYLGAGGDRSILDERRPYLEGAEDSLLGHLECGLRYALRFGEHGLLEIGVGDWNDALSAFGPRGESLWLNQMAYLCLGYFAEIAEGRGRDLEREVPALRERLFDAVVAGWRGDHFLRGYHESGAEIGAEERVFLLPQAWFTISGMAERDPAKGKAALDTMLSRLSRKDGLLKCDPPFTAFDPRVGNLSALTPGIAENFAVYNHASSFGVYALFLAGRRAEAESLLARLLPYSKDADRSLVEPYVLVNYYNGGYFPERAGRGGISWLTGTANWMAMIVYDFLAPGEAPTSAARLASAPQLG